MMQLPQLRMESQFASIQMTQDYGGLEIQQKRAEVSIQQPKAQISMTTRKGKLSIDQTAAWQQVNLGSTKHIIERQAQEAMQAVQEGTARRAEQGAEMLDIHLDREVFAELAVINGSRPLKQVTIAYMPSPFAVKTSYENGQVDIEVQENKPQIDVQVRSPEITYHRSHVDIAMEKYAQLQIDFVDLFK